MSRAIILMMDSFGVGAAHDAADFGDVTLSALLLSYGKGQANGSSAALLGHATPAGMTPLHAAVPSMHCFAELLAAGADINLPNAAGVTPAQLWLATGDVDNAPIADLIELGAERRLELDAMSADPLVRVFTWRHQNLHICSMHFTVGCCCEWRLGLCVKID